MGRWILDKQEEMQPPHIQLIRNLYKELQDYKRKPLTEHTMRMIRELQRDLDIARKFQPALKPNDKKNGNTLYFMVNMMSLITLRSWEKTSFGRCNVILPRWYGVPPS